nr:carboxypeptidase regulatory-like domain-containing protein [Treponema sp.]
MKKVFKVVGAVVAFAMALMFVGCSGITGDEKLSEPGLINGKVVYSNSSDNSDIVVTIEKSDVLASTTVSADGHYSFADLDPGTYTVSASSSNSAEKAIQTNVTVLAGRTVTVKDLQLTATGKISGKIILDTTDLDKSGFLVIIPGTGIVDVTNEKGEYTLADVPAGTDYNLVVVYGTFKYFITEKVSTSAGQTATASNINLKVEDIKKELLTGNDGKDGTDGTDGKDGVDGLSINWLGTFKDVKEIEEPKTYDAYFNSTDGNSYIYIEKTWKILAGSGSAGEDGKDGQDGNDLEGISTGGAEKLTYVSAVATEKGIKFSGTILSNISSNEYSNSAQAVIEIQDIDADMYMHQDWKKSSSAWDSWELTYPFVEEGKEYNFRVRASCTNWTMYEEFITITATGGLGEYQSTNREDLKAELTKDKVLKRIGTPEFTKNEKVQILKTGTKFDFYRDGAWQTWVYDTILWDDGKGELDLQKQLPSWQNFERVNNLMSGHKYWGRIHTYIKVAGYTYNDTVYFQMNDFAHTEDDWGGEVQKVYVITDPNFYYNNVYNVSGIEFDDVPGEEIEYVWTVKSEDGKEENLTFKFKTIVINYGDSIKEPTNSPYVKNAAKSEFNYWMNGNGKISFPYAPTTENGYELKPDGEPVNFLAFMVPDMSIYYNATLMDGDKEIGKSEYIFGKGISYTPKKEGYLFVGWCTDKECTEECKFDKPGDITVYAKFVEATNLLECDAYYIQLQIPEDITFDIGDTLYFETKNESSIDRSDSLRISSSGFDSYVNYNLGAGETELLSKTFTSASNVQNINTNGINVQTYYTDVRVKNIYYVKGPRVNVKIYDGTTLLQTIEAVPNRDVKVPMIRKNTSIIQGLYTDSSLENA